MFNKKIIKEVLDLALPAVFEMILYMLIWVLDTMMVGKYGGQVTVSTVGLSSEIMYTLSNVFVAMGLSIGTISLVSRKLGNKDKIKAEHYASLGSFATFVIGLFICTNTLIFAPKILYFAGARDTVLSLGIIYMRITSVGIFFNMLMNILNAVLKGSKNTKTPLIASIIINIINLFLDWVLIFGKLGFPELGVKGAAIATATAQITGFIFILIYTFKFSEIKLRFKYIKKINKGKLIKLIKLSTPASMQQAAIELIRLIGTVLIMYLGQISFAANQITTTIESVSFMPATGFSIAATTLVGHKIGNKEYKEAKHYAYICTIIGITFMLICSIMFLIVPRFLISLFIKKTELDVIKLGTTCLMIASIEQVPMGISMILGGALKGSGDTKTPFFISLISSWFIRLPLLVYLIYYLKLPVTFVWWISSIQWIFEGLAIFIAFKRKFSKIKLNSNLDNSI